MEETLVYLDAVLCGSMHIEDQGLYTMFSANCDGQEDRLYSLVLEGEQGRFLIGVPEWCDGKYMITRTVAKSEWQSVGKVRCARMILRNADGLEKVPEEGWIYLSHPEYFFKTLTPQLYGSGKCYWKQETDGRYLAVPMEEGRPFLLPKYFCFAQSEYLFGKHYAVFFFDNHEQPCIPTNKKPPA